MEDTKGHTNGGVMLEVPQTAASQSSTSVSQFQPKSWGSIGDKWICKPIKRVRPQLISHQNDWRCFSAFILFCALAMRRLTVSLVIVTQKHNRQCNRVQARFSPLKDTLCSSIPPSRCLPTQIPRLRIEMSATSDHVWKLSLALIAFLFMLRWDRSLLWAVCAGSECVWATSKAS